CVGRGSELVAYVVGACDTSSLKSALRQRLPEYMVPSHVVVVDVLPLTVNGKLDVKRLPEPWLESSTSDDPPRGELEGQLARIFAEVLGRSGIGRSEDFFALGGHSLRAIQVVSRVRSELGIELGLGEVFSEATVGGLAQVLSTRRPERYAPI